MLCVLFIALRFGGSGSNCDPYSCFFALDCSGINDAKSYSDKMNQELQWSQEIKDQAFYFCISITAVFATAAPTIITRGNWRGWGWNSRSCHLNLEVKIFSHFHDLYWQNFLFILTKLLLISTVMTEILVLACCVLCWICHQSPKWCMTNLPKIVPWRLVFLIQVMLAGLKKTKSNCCLDK